MRDDGICGCKLLMFPIMISSMILLTLIFSL